MDFEKVSENVIELKGLTLDKVTKNLTVEGRLVKMTKTEFNITELLMSHPGRVFSIDEIYESVWGRTKF